MTRTSTPGREPLSLPTRGLVLGLLVALLASGIAAAGLSPVGDLDSAAASAGSLAVPPTAARWASATTSPSPTARPSYPTIAPAAAYTTVPPTLPPAQGGAGEVLTPTSEPVPVPTAAPVGTNPRSEAEQDGYVIGYSVEGRPITAHRIGDGLLKVVLVGDIHGGFEANTHLLAQQLLAHFRAHPAEVPANVSLWIIPTMNPDGLAAGTRWNAHDVDLNRNADTDLDGCAGNDWAPDTVGLEGSHPGAGGAYPFSEPETRAIRDFMGDAWIAVFYHSADEAIYGDTCQRHLSTARLATVLSEATGYPIPSEGWSSYPITGEFGDYLAGEGVAAVTVELIDHQAVEFERNLAGVKAILTSADEIVSAEVAQTGAEYGWLVTKGVPGPSHSAAQSATAPAEGTTNDAANTGVWRYPDGTFVHPEALEVIDDTAYLLDGGRVLALHLAEPAQPQVLLAPGDDVATVHVLEPLDLVGVVDEDPTSGQGMLLVLDRAGDVYRYEPESGAWNVERYGRSSGETSDHYYVALADDGADRYLLETTHEKVWRFRSGDRGAAWATLPKGRDVDLGATGQDAYVLTRAMNNPTGALIRYRDGQQVTSFQPAKDVTLMHPRQVLATESAAYVLDRAGRRLLVLDPLDGQLQALYQFSDRRAVSALWAGQAGSVILAGRDALYFYGQPERQATVEGEPTSTGRQAYDPAVLESLRGLLMPIDGAHFTSRDFQSPGAPRHYRLGVHEGSDFYTSTAGVTVNRSTEVRAVADGLVVRAMVDYTPLTSAQAQAWAAEWQRLGYTPPEVLDGYRGQQVWIEHEGGLVSRYAHLGSIAAGIKVGISVKRGQTIGTVGNSGTPESLNGPNGEVHLHLELWLGDHYVGQFMRPIETREWMEKILQ